MEWMLRCILGAPQRAGHNSRSSSFRVLCLLLAFACSPAPALAGGFGSDFVASTGDFNGDARVDVLLRRNAAVTVLHGSPIATVPRSRSSIHLVLLEQLPNGTLVPVALSAASSLDSFSVNSGISVSRRDANWDGFDDLILSGMASAAGLDDHIVHWNGASDQPAVTRIDAEFRDTLIELRNWVADRDYFANAAPTITITVPQTTGTGWYYFSETSQGIASAQAQCLVQHPSSCSGPYRGFLSSIYSPSQCDDLANDGIPCDRFGNHLFGFSSTTVFVDVDIPDFSVFPSVAIDVATVIASIFSKDAGTFAEFQAIALGWNSLLNVPVSIGTESTQCMDAPAVQEAGMSLGPLTVPAGYGVYYCGLAAVAVGIAVAEVILDVVDVIGSSGVFSDGRATSPAPHSHAEEEEARNFIPDPFRSQCPPPTGDGSLRASINVLRAQIAWRYTDLNPESPTYPGHSHRIHLLEKDLAKLEKAHITICGQPA